MSPQHGTKKYESIINLIRHEIKNKKFMPGSRLPTEREFASQFDVSRPTVTRALNDLVAEGLITRRVGSGSYVASNEQKSSARTFGLLVPGLGRGEIFEPICAKIAEKIASDRFSLSWGASSAHGDNREELLRIARNFIDLKVDGVFLQPMELHPERVSCNTDVINLFSEHNIPIVLLDADYLAFPERSRFDLVGIDNIRAGFLVTKHLLDQGATRVDFIARPFTATTAVLRLHGYRLALLEHGLSPNPQWEHSIDTKDVSRCGELVKSGAEDIVCVSDETAAYLLVSLEKLGVIVPDQLRLVGFDDLKYAQLMRVPLSSIHQPCDTLGTLAVKTMYTRIQNPDHPGRKMLVDAELVVRKSSQRA